MKVLGVAGFLTLVALAGLTAYVLRASFVMNASRLDRLSERTKFGLQLLGPAAVGALIGPRFIRIDAPTIESVERVVAGLLAGYIAWRTKNVLLTILVGLVTVFVLQQIRTT
jgi:branched-subunit amino acid transport protein